MTTKVQKINHIAKLIKKATTVTGSRTCIKSLADQVQAAIDAETIEQYSELVTRVNPTETYTELTERVTPTETYTELKERVLGLSDTSDAKLSQVRGFATSMETETDLEEIGTLVTNINDTLDSTDAELTGTFVFDEPTAMFKLVNNTVDLLNPIITFWGANYAYQPLVVATEPLGDKTYSYTQTVASQGIVVEGTTSIEGNTFIYDYIMTASQSLSGITGAVLEFKFSTVAEPDAYIELLDDNYGFIVKGLTCGDITVQFENPMVNFTGTAGLPSNVRAAFIGGTLEPGEYPNTMSIILPDTIEIIETLAEILTPVDSETWLEQVLDITDSPIDLSYLNDETSRGALTAVGDKLIFEDETEGRFWGCNVQAYGLFNTLDADIIVQAERIAKLGYNLVRIHHHDSHWVSPNIFGYDSVTNTLTLSETSFAKLDLWMSELEGHGVYIWLDLHVQRAFMADDGIDNWTELSGGGTRVEMKGISYFEPDIEQLMKDFNENYLNHVNTITEVAYKNDPYVVALLLTNENDVTHHYGWKLVQNNYPNLKASFDPVKADFATANDFTTGQLDQFWVHGPSKLLMNDVEHAWNERMISHLDGLSVSKNIATTNFWGGEAMTSLPSLMDSDIIDVHTYGGADFISDNPLYKPNYASFIAAGAINGRPVSVTEWNIGLLTYDRFTAQIHMAAMACLHEWDMMMVYGYSQQNLSNGPYLSPDPWSGFTDPAAMALNPIAALMYREKHVSAAQDTYILSVGSSTFYNTNISPVTSASIRTIFEQSKLIIDVPAHDAIPWVVPAEIPEGAIVIDDLDVNYLSDPFSVTSDTGEIYRNWKTRISTINTSKSQAIMGWLGDKTLSTDDLTVEMDNKVAAVAICTLENKSIPTSDIIWITIVTRTLTYTPKIPFYSEPLSGTIKVKAKSGLTLYEVSNTGVETEYSSSYADGEYTFSVDSDVNTFWFILHAAE